MNSTTKSTIKQTSIAAGAGLLLLILSFFISGGGNASFDFARVVFPYTMLSTYNNEPIQLPFILIAILQFPVYLLIFKKFIEFKYMLLILFGINLIFVELAFNFSGNVFN